MGITRSRTKIELFSSHLLEQGNLVSHEVCHRSEQVAKKISQGSKEATAMLKGSGQNSARALARRSEQISDHGRTLTLKLKERDLETWTMIGFATGLVLALIAVYLFIRSRMRQQTANEEELSIPIVLASLVTTRCSPHRALIALSVHSGSPFKSTTRVCSLKCNPVSVNLTPLDLS